MRIQELLTIPLLAFVLLLSGCIKDDRSDCAVDDNCELLFEYSTATTDKFPEHIHSVDVVLFDAQGRYLMHAKADQQSLAAYRGLKLTLDPGKYHVVAWANVKDNSQFCQFVSGTTPFDDCLVEIHPNCSESGDPVYYAPFKAKPVTKSVGWGPHTRAGMDLYEVVVPYGGTVVKVLDFVRAHRSVYVWSRDYTDIVNGRNLCPTVEAKNLWSGYDFHFTTKAQRRDFKQCGTECTVNGVTYSLSTFHHAYGKIENDMNFEVRRTSDNTLRTTVNLKKFLADNPSADTDDIHIMVTFLDDLGVEISLPEWVEKNITPGFE